jgi:hypothetical protein
MGKHQTVTVSDSYNNPPVLNIRFGAGSDSTILYTLLKNKTKNMHSLHCKKSESYLPQESVWLAGGPTQTS